MYETFFYKDQRLECHCLVAKDVENKIFVFKELAESTKTSVINSIRVISNDLSKNVDIPLKEMNIYEISLTPYQLKTSFSCSKLNFKFDDNGRPIEESFVEKSRDQFLNEISHSSLSSYFNKEYSLTH